MENNNNPYPLRESVKPVTQVSKDSSTNVFTIKEGSFLYPKSDQAQKTKVEIDTFVKNQTAIFIVNDDSSINRKFFQTSITTSSSTSPMKDHKDAGILVFSCCSDVVGYLKTLQEPISTKLMGVITDYETPKSNGFEVVTTLRMRGFTGAIVVASSNINKFKSDLEKIPGSNTENTCYTSDKIVGKQLAGLIANVKQKEAPFMNIVIELIDKLDFSNKTLASVSSDSADSKRKAEESPIVTPVIGSGVGKFKPKKEDRHPDVVNKSTKEGASPFL